jgi:peptidoglycan hydrolase-like protein with peptidoglycan-binding domain
MLKRSLAFILAIVLIMALSPVSAERLQYRDKGSRVKVLQQLLTAKNHYSGEIDSEYTYAVVLAVRSFQRSVGLKADGIAGPLTLKAIGMGDDSAYNPSSGTTLTNDFPLRYGYESDLVKNVQTMLKNLNFYSGDVDGKYLDSTIQAVRLFQRQNHLKVDGIVGNRTLSALQNGKPYNPSAPAPAKIRVQYDNTGPTVLAVKNRLQQLKYFPSTLSLTNHYDYNTVKAVRRFQANNGLQVDGIIGEETWKALFADSAIAGDNKPFTPPDPSTVDPNSTNTLRYGHSSVEVAKLQEQLKSLGYYSGSIQYLFDYRTYQAVRSYQKANGLKVDGVAGPITRSSIAGTLGTAPVKKPVTPGDGSISLSEVEVAKLQTRLKALGYYNRLIDGKAGYYTDNAVRAFKIKNGLFIDNNKNGVYDGGDVVTSTLTATVYNKIFEDSAMPAK